MSSPALQAHLDPAGKVLDDLRAFLPWVALIAAFRSGIVWSCCYAPCPKGISTDKNLGGLIPVNAATTACHTCGLSVGQGNAAVAMPMIRFRSGGWHHPAGTTGRL